MNNRITYNFPCKGLSAYLDERIPKMDMVISGHINELLAKGSDRETLDLLLDLHFALQNYIEKFGL